MKIIIVEATADELKANKRVADSIIDAFTSFADNIIKLKDDTKEDDDDGTE